MSQNLPKKNSTLNLYQNSLTSYRSSNDYSSSQSIAETFVAFENLTSFNIKNEHPKQTVSRLVVLHFLRNILEFLEKYLKSSLYTKIKPKKARIYHANCFRSKASYQTIWPAKCPRSCEIYGLIGKNGAGKTTLLKTISRLIHANSGTVSVFGSQNSKEWNEALRKIGTVIETPVAYNQMTAYQNLNYYCKVHQIAQPDQLIKETLAYVGLSNTGKKKFRNFSLGMKQRLGIAIALISKPELMILDEPINGLDPLGIKEFRLMIQRLNQELGITFIISSHILSELYLVATKFGVIDQGRLVAEFTKDDFDRASEDYIVLKTSDRDQAANLIQGKLHYQLKDADKSDELHIVAQEQELNDINRELVLSNIHVNGIYAAHKDLEKYFTDLVQ